MNQNNPRIFDKPRKLGAGVWIRITRQPWVSLVVILLMLGLLGAGYVLGLRTGYETGYFYALSESGLLELSLDLRRVEFLDQENDESLRNSLELGIDISLGDIFYGVGLDPLPWYVNTRSPEEQAKHKQVWGGVLEDAALYRSQHPGNIVAPNDLAYEQLMAFYPEHSPDTTDTTRE